MGPMFSQPMCEACSGRAFSRKSREKAPPRLPHGLGVNASEQSLSRWSGVTPRSGLGLGLGAERVSIAGRDT